MVVVYGFNFAGKLVMRAQSRTVEDSDQVKAWMRRQNPEVVKFYVKIEGEVS